MIEFKPAKCQFFRYRFGFGSVSIFKISKKLGYGSVLVLQISENSVLVSQKWPAKRVFGSVNRSFPRLGGGELEGVSSSFSPSTFEKNLSLAKTCLYFHTHHIRRGENRFLRGIWRRSKL
jgi:hypothetical protein